MPFDKNLIETTKKIKREVIFKNKFHLLVIFIIFLIFSFVIFRAIKLLENKEQDVFNLQTLEYNYQWEKFDEAIRSQVKSYDQLNLNIKKEVEIQLTKESGILKKESLQKVYEKFPELNNIDIELFLLDPQGVPAEHPENPSYASKAGIDKVTLENFKLNKNKATSYVYTNKESKKIIFLREIELNNRSGLGFLSMEINPKILLNLTEDFNHSFLINTFIFDEANKTIFDSRLDKNFTKGDVKFTDLTTLVNYKKNGDLLFISTPFDMSPFTWAVYISKENLLSSWLIEKSYRLKVLTAAIFTMIAAVLSLIYFVNRLMRAEVINRLKTIELQDNLSEKEHVITLLSHEIRTPLNVIFGLSQLSNDSSITKEELVKNNDSIKSATIYLTKLVNEILKFNKLSDSGFVLHENFYSIDFLFENLKFLFKNRSKNDVRIFFINEISPDIKVKCDEFQLQQVLINLIENSFKFTSHGSIEIAAEEISRDDDSLVIRFSVSDTGIGIKKDEQNLIFEPFTQANSSILRNYGGTGLGLSISKRIVERLGSKLELRSEEGAGSCFYFNIDFSYVIEESSQINSSPKSTPLSSKQSPAKIDFDSLHMNGRVLLVDDHATSLDIMEKFLQKIGLRVTTASNGESAIKEITRNSRFDMVIMDIQMPGLSGIETTKIIRLYEDENQIKRVPIISLSANSSDKNIEDCILAGMDDFIEKPADFNKVHQVINTWIRS